MRASEVGVGLAARRIFADLASGPPSQIRTVEQAHADGMLPVISYKVGGDIDGAVSGRFNAVAEQAAARLASYGLPTAVTFWHEPNPDCLGCPVRRGQQAAAADLQAGRAAGRSAAERLAAGQPDGDLVGLLPRRALRLWDWVGYRHLRARHPGAAGKRKPADRIPALAAFLRSRGFDLPMAVGEYNGYSAADHRRAGEALLTTPNVWFGCVFNSDRRQGRGARR